MARNRRNVYEVVNELPTEALTVAQYAAAWPCNTSYIYKIVRTGKNTKFKIVDYKGINFVIPV